MFRQRFQRLKGGKHGKKQYWLRPGDPVPTWEPRRFQEARGYVVVRWFLESKRHLVSYEHRIAAGLPTADVHHRNGAKSDNAVDNLQILDRREHGKHHAQCTWDIDEARLLYLAGSSLAQLAAKYGITRSNVYLRFTRHGGLRRTRSEACRLSFQRGDRKRRTPKTHCRHGHEFTHENTLRDRRQRHCRTCRDLRKHRVAEAERLG